MVTYDSNVTYSKLRKGTTLVVKTFNNRRFYKGDVLKVVEVTKNGAYIAKDKKGNKWYLGDLTPFKIRRG